MGKEPAGLDYHQKQQLKKAFSPSQ